MAPLTRRLHLLVAMTLVGGEMAAQGGPDAWRPQTVPLFGASYSPDIGLLLGAGVVHTRYGFRALPPSTQLLAEAAYATGANTYRIDVAGEFRRPLLPTILSITASDATGKSRVTVARSVTSVSVCETD